MIFYWYYYLLGLILLPGIIMSIWAQTKTKNTFDKYDDVLAECDKPAHELARHLLDSAGLKDIKVTRCSGHLTDHYNPKTKTVSLSDSVYDSTSISSLGVMAHELGHVMQYKDNYSLIKLRTFLIPVINFSSFLMWPLVILGVIIEITAWTRIGTIMIIIGICIFALSTILSLITLPIEKNASARVEKLLVETGYLSKEEYKGVKQVLNAAGLTYLAALVTSILSLLRFLIFIAHLRDD